MDRRKMKRDYSQRMIKGQIARSRMKTALQYLYSLMPSAFFDAVS
jgi:hypothetical protein